MKYIFRLAFALTLIIGLTFRSAAQYKSDRLEIEPLTKYTYVHRSFLETASWGKVSCNGLVYIHKGEALIFDTPTNNQASAELINWVENKMHAKVKGVIVNHFHDDCLGGLEVFHNAGIESYSSKRTQELAKADTLNKPVIPKNGFDEKLPLNVGGEIVLNKFFGEGHTKDNIVSYIPADKVLFGGCLIKESGAGKGNLADANVGEWANTVDKVKKEYPGVKFVVPGHGKPGDNSLLDYTMSLFRNQ